MVTTVPARDTLHQLVDALPNEKVAAAERLLESLRDDRTDPLLAALLAAPEDDEPSSSEEDASAAAAWEAYRRGEARPWEAVRQELAADTQANE